jgi:hypothetical protein
LKAVLAQGTNDLSEVVPLLADLLSIPLGDRYRPLNLTPQKRKERTLHASWRRWKDWQRVNHGLGGRTRSDPTTRESLDLVIDRAPTFRVFVIMTFRPEFTPP